MSTKTTFNRIALVTVAALGFGMLSVVPSNAIVSGTSSTGSLTATLGTATATPGVTGQEMVISVPYTITAADNSDTITIAMSLQTKPSTSSAANSDTYWTTQATSAAITDGGVANFTKSAGVALFQVKNVYRYVKWLDFFDTESMPEYFEHPDQCHALN